MADAGRQIISQGSSKNVPKANELSKLNERKQKNYVKENLNKVVFDMKPPVKAEKIEDDVKKLNKNYG